MRRFIQNKNKSTNRSRLLIYRWLLLLITSASALLTDKIEIVLNLAGSIAIPIISFYLPVIMPKGRILTEKIICNFLYSRAYKKPMGWLWGIHDTLIMIVVLLVQFFGVKYSIEV